MPCCSWEIRATAAALCRPPALQANLAKFPSPIVLANDGIFTLRLNGGFLRRRQDGNSGEIHRDGRYPNASRSTR